MSLSAIARQAGVSPSTVSRYVKGELRLSEQTEAKIKAAMEDMGIHGKPGVPGTVSLVIPELTNPYFAELAEQFSIQAGRRGVEARILVTGGSIRREAELLRSSSQAQDVLGTLFVTMAGDPEALSSVVKGHPVVVLDERLDAPEGVAFVGADSRGGAYQATAFLLSMGHRRIAHLAGPQALSSTGLRRAGYETALRDHGVEVDEEIVIYGPHSESFGANVLPRLLQLKDRPTAVFAGSDIIAIGLMAASDINGVKIPDELSVIGFDGISVGAWLRPRLATVAQPFEQLVRRALDLIAAQVLGGAKVAEESLPMLLRPADSVRRLS